MTLATRCPRCATVFRLVPEQLLLAGGWVRCGCCQVAFDAAASRFDFQPEQAAPAPPGPPPADPAADAEQATALPPVAAFRFEPDPQATPEPGLEPRFSQAPDPLPEPRFLRQARARQRWGSARRRRQLLLLAALLTMLLLGQGLWLARGELAARWPRTRPVLQQLCAWGHCRVQAPERLQQIEVAGSSLSPADDDQLLLQAQLRNRGDSAVAYPALELTLTGAPSQILVRKIIQPQDYLARSGASPAALRQQLDLGLGPGAELALALPLQPLTGVAASSYSLLAFYP